MTARHRPARPLVPADLGLEQRPTIATAFNHNLLRDRGQLLQCVQTQRKRSGHFALNNKRPSLGVCVLRSDRNRAIIPYEMAGRGGDMIVEQVGRKLTINGLLGVNRHTGFCPQQGFLIRPSHRQ